MDPKNPHVIWVGTGENNNQRSVAYGDGIYKSEDGVCLMCFLLPLVALRKVFLQGVVL